MCDGIVEKWNKLAKKSIYINHTLQIGVGRLVFTMIIFLIEVVSIILLTGNWAAVSPLWSTFLLTLQRRKDEE